MNDYDLKYTNEITNNNYNESQNFKEKKKRPEHPFPYMTRRFVGYDSVKSVTLTSKQNQLIQMLRSGARVLFDIKAKRGLVYTFKRGIENLMEITVRMLSSLIKSGKVVAVAREGRIVHYALESNNCL